MKGWTVAGDSDQSLSFVDSEGRLGDPQRLRRLLETGLMNSGGDPSLDRLAKLAAVVTGSSMGLVSLVEQFHQVYPGAYGLPDEVEETRQTPLTHSICQYIVMHDAPLVVSDIHAHPVLSDSPSVRDYGVRAYAGFPLHGPDSEVLGAFCVLENSPVEWTPEQLAVLEDLARAVETELALRLRTREVELASERLHQAINGATHTGFVAADRDGTITIVNQAAEVLLGTSAAELVGRWKLKHLPQLFRHAAPADADADMTAELEHRGPGEWIVENDLGSRRIVSIRLTVLRDARGERDGYVLVGNDVTAHHQTQAALHDVIGKQADAVDRLLELDRARHDFIATASHELRTPVTSILGFTELLNDGAAGDLTSDQARLLDRVDSNGKRLLHLMEDLLNLSALEARGPAALERSVLDATQPGVRAWKSLQPLLRGRRLQADLFVADDLPNVYGDVVQLECAIHHLLSSSVKFTPDGGTITFSIVRENDDVVFEVAVTGVGIREDEHLELFDPFFRTREAQSLATPGAGLGLAVVRSIVEAHGAEINVTSRRDVGTTVRILMPVSLAV